MTKTTNLELNKPDVTDFYDITVHNENMDKLDTAVKGLSDNKAEKTAVEELKKSVSDGKVLVASAITGKGVTTAADATFATMASNIGSIMVGIDTSGTTSVAGDILVGKTAGSKGSIITGTMKDNGAVNQSLSANGTYTIPAGYHNGSGKVTQNLTTKSATTITPGDTVQTIAAGQYLSGAQTIAAVPTETKTVTAGTAAQTVNRTTGKYMTAVTVNPTPSNHKTVTLTSSPLIVYPDSGKLLSGVTINASLGKKYETGTLLNNERTLQKNFDVYYNGSATSSNLRYIVINCSFVPSFIIYVGDYSTIPGYFRGFVSSKSLLVRNTKTYNALAAHGGTLALNYATTIGTSTEVSISESIDTSKVDITWYAFE